MIVAVFDCSVYVQAALSRKGPAFACLSLAEADHVVLYLSPEILDEVKRTLAQPVLRRKYSKLTDESVARFLDGIETITVMTTANPSPVFSLPRDPTDEVYVNLAIAVSASFVVSRDPDLLDLMQDDEFCRTYPRMKIVDPLAFLRHVRAEVGRELGYD